MPAAPRPIEILPTDGGQLIAEYSHENVGPANYIDKTNWRRNRDGEVNREGYVYFRPLPGLPETAQSSILDDIIMQCEAIRPNGDRAVIAASKTTIYRFNTGTGTWTSIGTGFSPAAKRWQWASLNGWLMLNNGVDLPVTYRVEDPAVSPVYELREMGVATVGFIATYNNFIFLADITEFIDDELADWMNGSNPYGAVPDNLTQRIHYKLQWSQIREPRNWGLFMTGTIESATPNTIVLEYPVQGFQVGDRVAVFGAGPLGGLLGGQPGIENGVPITFASGNVIQIDAVADPSLTYPISVTVQRWDDTSSFTGSVTLTDDSSPIVAIAELKQQLIVYRSTKIWSGRYTGDFETPFAFKIGCSTLQVPIAPQVIATLNGDAHVYATQDSFYSYDGLDQPQIFNALDRGKRYFFDLGDGALTIPDEGWAFDNPFTKELWFVRPDGCLCYDYRTGTASVIDEGYKAGGVITRPGTLNEYWVTLWGGNTRVYQYGHTADGPFTWYRLGEPFENRLASGLLKIRDGFNERFVRTYVPTLGTGGTSQPLTIKIFATDDAASPAELLFTHEMTDPVNKNLVPMHYQRTYFRDEIQLNLQTDSQIKIVSKIWELAAVTSKSVVRRIR